MTEEQEQTAADWKKHDGENSADAAVGQGSDRSPDLLQMLRAAESRRGAPPSRDQDPTEAGGPVTEAQRTDMVSWDVSVAQ